MNLQTNLDELIGTLNGLRSSLSKVDEAGRLLLDAIQKGRKILTCGNGGSAADALHMAEELSGRYQKDRRALPGICLCADPTAITCIANDYGFDFVFSRQVEALGAPGDVLVTFSTSGNSPSILKAINAAREKKLITIALLGKDGGKAKGMSDLDIIVPSNTTARIQEVHTFILHGWLEQIDANV